jgi:sigma-B regulation protein RsbU (phosphoserine phosphatase)
MIGTIRIHGGHREQGLRRAAQVQRSLLPRSMPEVPGYEFFAYYRPAGPVGGDYYDFIPLPGDRWAIALGDVSGKGVPAALIGARFSGSTRHCILAEPAPAQAAVRLNQQFCDSGIEDGFITLSLGVLDVASRQFTCCSAGHPPILIRRANGCIDECGPELDGCPIGLMPDSVYNQADISLEPGDVVVIYSDGVTDARNVCEEMYDSKTISRLRERLGRTSGGPIAAGRAIVRDLDSFSAGNSQFDDVTLICFGPVQQRGDSACAAATI